MTENQPYRYEKTNDAASLIAEYGEIEAGSETGDVVTVAGRLMLRRVQGKLIFGTLQDSSGRVQLFARAQSTPDFDRFGGLSLGDWIGVTGQVMKTRAGELSVAVDSWTLLAETKRSFPDKWHGITDTDMRYRQRYVDLWVTDEAREVFRVRAEVMRLTRRYLEDRGFVEVETPVLHPIPGGAAALPFVTHHNSLDQDLYLRIAPELYLKRLVVGGMERVFELGRVFRNEGMGNRWNPEFTMLELYQAYADYDDMQRLTEELVAHLAQEILGTTVVQWDGKDVDLAAPWRRATMSDLIEEAINVRVDVRTDIDEMRKVCLEHGATFKPDWGVGKMMFELYEKVVEANLWSPTFVLDYPKEVSPLSRDHREMPDTVERFEAVVTGREIANAFSELNDPAEQRLRFEDEQKAKEAGDDEAGGVDEDYLRALEYGLPPTGGMGLGIDRVVQLLTGTTTIKDVILFPTLRPEAQ